LEKTVKNHLSVGGSAPEPPFVSRSWGLRPQTLAFLLSTNITSLSSSFLALNAFYYPKKKNKITTANVLFLLLTHFCTYFSLQTL